MKAFPMVLLVALILVLGGCSEKAAGGKAESATPAVAANELTPEEKFAQLQKRAETGDAEAQYSLARMYVVGDGIPKDEAKALEWLQKAATQSYADAQYVLGNMYASGYLSILPKDIAKAAEWYQKAAAQGNAKAQYTLGEMYSIGGEMPFSDEAKAIEWYQKAAEQGYVDAQVRLVFNYYFGAFGKKSPSDYAKAFEWAQKAAEKGNPPSQFFLGLMYLDGKGVRKDAAKAFEWFHKAAEHGHESAQAQVGDMYANGEGIPKNAEKAFEWYLKAASNGHANSENSLGVSYQRGEGVTRNLVLAYAWYNLAAAQGDKNGNKNRDRIEAQLTHDQRAEGQRLATNWKKGDTLLVSGGSSSGSATPNDKPSKLGTGTAFAISSDGHALTNHHVINGCAEVKIAGREGIAKVITSDSVNDLALLQLPGKTKDMANLNPDPGKLRQGEDIIVFGYPLNAVLSSGGNLTPGTLSALTGLGNNTNQIQITAPIQPGSSGSPVMDKKGNVVGVVSMKLDDVKMARATGQVGQNVNFAVNGQTVRAFLDANQVPYKTGGGFFSREKSNADIAEEARKWTVLVECWK